MVDAEVELVSMYILGEVDKTGIAVLKNIIDQFLHNAEDDQFFFFFKSFLVLMETAAGIDGTRAADLLEQVVDGRLQPEVL